MRVLAVRGENLASLAAPFEIDFGREPLASAGLFAITGETGAGKSTILDAICLALYGAYPRVANAGNEKAPDPSGNDLGGKDPRALLRRGAGKGFAEVDFLATDGQSYRVRWEALRARGRANGSLQDVRRKLFRIVDNQPIAVGVTAVLAKVQVLTDFTFDQFRRTVLLAQGEFDAFLLADKNERAELLEKVTGTEIYAALSKRAYAEAERRGQAVGGLELRRASIGVLDAPTRAALMEECAQIALDVKATAAAIDAMKGRLEHHARIGAAREKCAQAAKTHEAALLASAALAPERDLLAQLDRAEILRPTAAAFARAKDSLARAERALAEAALAHGRAGDAATAAAVEREKAQAWDIEAEDCFKAFGPIWTGCEQLDKSIEFAAKEHEKAAALRIEAERRAKESAAELQSLDGLRATAIASRARAAASLEDRPERAILSDRIADVEELLKKRGELRGRSRRTQEANARAVEEARRLGGLIEAAKSSADELRRERDRLDRECEARDAALAALDEEELLRRDRDLGDLLGGLGAAANMLDRHIRAQDERVRSTAACASAIGDMAQAEAERAGAQISLGAHKAARAEIIALIDLADVTVSRQAIELRASLVAGEPCPVCGGVDHPHADDGGGGAEFVARILARRAELDQLIATAASAVEQAASRFAGAKARHESALQLGATALADLQAREAEYTAVVADLDTRRAALGFVEPLAPAADGAQPPLLRLAAKVRADREALAEPLGRAANLRADLDMLRRALRKAAATLDQKMEALAAQTLAFHAAELERSNAEIGLRELGDRLVSIDRELTPFLHAGAVVASDLDRDAETVAKRLKAIAEERRQMEAAFAEAESSLRALEPKRAGTVETLAAATETLRAATAEAAIRARDLDSARQERAALLDGEPTSAHRTRHNDMRLRARTGLDSAREAESEAAKALAAAAHGEDSQRAAWTETELIFKRSEQDFAAAIAEAGFTSEGVRDLLETAPAAREELRAKIAAIDAALLQAAASHDERRRDRDDLLARGGDEEDADVLTAEVTSLQEKADTAHRRFGGIDNQLAQDDAARGSAAALSLEIEAAEADLAIWQAVNEAIGSAEGDKFRRFAQSVTLDHLVALADRHLAALAPRYRLERAAASDLSIHVIDRDMGDEKRAARSLSGGERFLVSLSLAIALSGLEGRHAFVDTLFVDEGFGSLDPETLDVAIDALETLHGQGRKVGVVTHVAAMIERIAVQVRVEKRGNGRSAIRVAQAGAAALA